MLVIPARTLDMGAVLDCCLIRHHLQFTVQARTTVAAEEMFIDLAAATHSVESLWFA